MIQFLHIIEMLKEQEEPAASSGHEPESTEVQEQEYKSSDSGSACTKEEEDRLLETVVAWKLFFG